ncbi:chromogranin-A-like isoform X1 [Sinocyclocheilus grahami]|uniref:chromogranin-A-like isoform X1 n=1 Tax=Sinocyclocheilus grahami TaxID=75366 RepID=UPI0007AD3DBD|nr:PREDICTED: chromogranin-A-like isoform X1 [Sinocyclocheilus grahami]
MIARGCAALVVLVNFVFSVPVSPGHMDDKDVKVMKCIVEVIADALSKPHLIPVSQDCLETLSADDRLVSILRHRNFLREMQDIAAEGSNERAQKHPGDAPEHVTSLTIDTIKTADDQSMLVALDKPEEDAEKRGAGEENSRESEETEQESQKRNQIAEEEELEEHESPSNHISNSINPEQNRESQEEATKREEDKQEKKHSSLEKEKENDPAHHKDGETATDDHEANPDIKQSIMEDSEEHKGAETERTHSKEELEEEEEKKREVGVKRWSHVSKLSHKRVEASPKLDEHWEAPQHSKEREGQEGELWRSPEEQELQLMAQTQPQDKRDEEGSGSRKTGDAEIESLAAIESELESVAQKLHDLRRG